MSTKARAKAKRKSIGCGSACRKSKCSIKAPGPFDYWPMVLIVAVMVVLTVLALVFARAAKSAQPLMPDQREQTLRQYFPSVDDEELTKTLADPSLFIYTDSDMPMAYQFTNGTPEMRGVHSALYNISAEPSEPFGNGNREFPWGTPAGTHRSKGVGTVRFIHLPRDSAGKRLPIVYYRKRLPGDITPSICWIFPVGTVVGEVLSIRGPDGLGYTFELRTRRRHEDHWEPNVYRPFTKPAELAARIKELRPSWQSSPALVAAVHQLEIPHTHLVASRLEDRQPGKAVFRETAAIDELPPLDPKLVSELLTSTKFKACAGDYWRASGNLAAFAPTTSADFHIVPANYDAGFMAIDEKSCMRCHDSTGRNVDEFDARRDWYGNVRGSDGILSFHPFDPSCISDNGFGRQPAIRQSLVDAGIVEKWDSTKHTPDRYNTIKGLAN